MTPLQKQRAKRYGKTKQSNEESIWENVMRLRIKTFPICEGVNHYGTTFVRVVD